MTRSLTANQAKVLDFIRRFRERHGFPPTHAEIARGLGYRSANAAAEHVRLLAKKGALRVTPRAARGIRLAEEEPPSSPARGPGAGLPLIGEVAAGQPVLAEERVERTVDVPPELFRPRADYLLRVRGDSMIEAGILPDDWVAVHRTPRLDDGAIGVVRLDGEVTVKRWRRRGEAVVLEPAHPDLAPRLVDPRRTDVAVEGRVVGLLRL